jgi:hypothetical protein
MKPLKRILSAAIGTLIIAFWTLATVNAQPTGFLPRDNNEAEAWQVYNKYKNCQENLRNGRNAFENAASGLRVNPLDPDYREDKNKALAQIEKYERLEKEALAAWEKKFYWRYGDLRWSDKQENGMVKDVKHGEMDHIAFALVYFPFDYKPGSLTPQTDNKQSAPNTLTLESPGYWGHLNYTINGARLDKPTGSDAGFVNGRQYTGELTGNTLSISGTAISDNKTPGPINLYYYEFTASVTAGNESKKTSYVAPVGEKLNQSYSLSVPVKPGVSGSFYISLLYENATYGRRGWIASGNFTANKNLTISTTPINTKTASGISKDGKTWTPINSNSNLKKGDQVKTGPNAASSLKLAELIKMVLNKSGWLQVTNESKSSPAIKLLDGNLKLSLPTLPYGSSFMIDCSQAIATVKGTSFELWENGQRSGIRVTEGMVEFKNKKTGTVTSVYAGQTVFADQQGTADLKQNPAIKETVTHEWGAETVLFKIESAGAVYNNPPKPTVFTLARSSLITKIMTYHWNGGRGAEPGTISLRNLGTGEVVGVWKVTGTKDMVAMGVAPYRYWMIFPNKTLPAGKYEVIDSDRATWSTNGEMGNRGCTWVHGKE